MRASRCYVDQISVIVLKVFVFQYFWAFPRGLRVSWWHLGATWGRLGSVLGSKTVHDRPNTAPRSHQDCFLWAPRLPKIVTRPRQDAPRALQEGDISADLEARCSFHQLSRNVLKVFVFQYFWGSPSPLWAPDKVPQKTRLDATVDEIRCQAGGETFNIVIG